MKLYQCLIKATGSLRRVIALPLTDSFHGCNSDWILLSIRFEATPFWMYLVTICTYRVRRIGWGSRGRAVYLICDWDSYLDRTRCEGMESSYVSSLRLRFSKDPHCNMRFPISWTSATETWNKLSTMWHWNLLTMKSECPLSWPLPLSRRTQRLSPAYVPEVRGHMMWAGSQYGHYLELHCLRLFHNVWNISLDSLDKIFFYSIFVVIWEINLI